MDPITISLAVLGTAFANEGIKFLWKQADTIATYHNERKYKRIDKEQKQQEQDAAPLEVNTGDTPKFLDLPPTLTIDFDRVEEKEADLAILRNMLTPYILGDTSPDASDNNLKRTMDALQEIIEYIYHHPLHKNKHDAPHAIVAATAGGKVSIEKGGQEVTGQGKARISADGEGSSITIGEIDQRVQS